MRNDGSAMKTRMITGTTVHSTSMSVLWVVRVGVGFARALKRTMTMIRSASTNAVMAKMTHSRMLWNHTMSSITGVADPCRPICQGEGWPSPAKAAPGISRATATAAIRIDRKRAGIVVSAPWMAAARARLRLDCGRDAAIRCII